MHKYQNSDQSAREYWITLSIFSRSLDIYKLVAAHLEGVRFYSVRQLLEELLTKSSHSICGCSTSHTWCYAQESSAAWYVNASVVKTPAALVVCWRYSILMNAPARCCVVRPWWGDMQRIRGWEARPAWYATRPVGGSGLRGLHYADN